MVSHHDPILCPLCEIVDIHHVVRFQEVLIGDNRTSIFTSIGKIHTQEENNSNGIVVIMETLLQ
jgi:hypothetical protein